MGWKRPAPCTECKSVLCHRADCSIGEAKRKGLSAPPVDRMVKAAAVRK